MEFLQKVWNELWARNPFTIQNFIFIIGALALAEGLFHVWRRTRGKSAPPLGSWSTLPLSLVRFGAICWVVAIIGIPLLMAVLDRISPEIGTLANKFVGNWPSLPTGSVSAPK